MRQVRVMADRQARADGIFKDDALDLGILLILLVLVVLFVLIDLLLI